MNINDKVLVKLTPLGYSILAANHEKAYEPPPTRPDGWTEFTLWGLMAEFGPHCYNGRVGTLFIDNEIRFPD